VLAWAEGDGNGGRNLPQTVDFDFQQVKRVTGRGRRFITILPLSTKGAEKIRCTRHFR